MWTVRLTSPARKSLRRIHGKDRRLLKSAFERLEKDPFGMDVRMLAGSTDYRVRVGNRRIFVDIDHQESTVTVLAIKRRTSTTYR